MKKMSLMSPMQIWNLARVNEWFEINDTSFQYPLKLAFEYGTQIAGEPQPNEYFFDNIYIPVKAVTENGIADNWTYLNVGLSTQWIARCYRNYNGLNYLSVPLYKSNPSESILELGDKIRSVFLMNKPKYLKLLELQGYTYNPLFNVDGVEIRQRLKNEGINNASSTYTPNSLTNTHSVSSYDSTTKTEYTDVQSGFSTNSTTYTHNNAKNRMVIDGEETDVDYHVQSKDTAFGEALSGGDKMENEKYIRQGNIGVTKTQELIEAERQNLRYSVVKEFFDDINEQLLVGIY